MLVLLMMTVVPSTMTIAKATNLDYAQNTLMKNLLVIITVYITNQMWKGIQIASQNVRKEGAHQILMVALEMIVLIPETVFVKNIVAGRHAVWLITQRTA